MKCISLAALAFILGVAVPAFGQFDRSQISGFVTDQTGAVVPGATVTALHVQTGTMRTTVTDSAGYYVFPTLTPGAYEVTVEL
jgi:protocatechuate 3,4-dioxygenase beta subunit